LAVYVSFAVTLVQTGGLAAAAVVTGSAALRSQTAANVADVAVQVFLLVGVLTSTRPPDASHPLGYGRERFFWSLLAAIGVLVGGCVIAFQQALGALAHPEPLRAFAVGYAVLAVSIALDAVALAAALRPLRAQAAARHLQLTRWLRRVTDPAATTEAVANAIGATGGCLALVALGVTQATGDARANALASGLIGLVLIAAAIVLVQTNRGLLTGRGVSPKMLGEMRELIASQRGVVAVADLFAVVIGQGSMIVDGDRLRLRHAGRGPAAPRPLTSRRLTASPSRGGAAPRE
jgi:cation diffusion facilitator family transporter